MHIIELHRKLQENRSEIIPTVTKYRARTAAIEDASKLLRSGYTPSQVYDFLGPNIISPSDIELEQARIVEREAKRRVIGIEEEGGYVAIMQR
jgi:hypothetical protein